MHWGSFARKILARETKLLNNPLMQELNKSTKFYKMMTQEPKNAENVLKKNINARDKGH